ncbi:MAG: hypothetical protein M3N34_06205 [Pseudomonadota bacterium]|nr:hypothetical protein [Pseudomonadota bacterium]
MKALLRKLRRPQRLPSTDLFFLNACGHRVAEAWKRAPITAKGLNCFVHGDAMLLVRSDTPEVMRAALGWPGRLAYIVDDDIAGAADSSGLPDHYRQRLASFDTTWHQPLIARADLLVAASDVLADGLAHRTSVQRIDPHWTLPLADQRHFAGLEQGGELRIAHLGSGSHHGGLCAIAPAVTALLDRDDAISFTYVAAQMVSAALEAHPRARRLAPRNWSGYCRWLRHARFHLALYPLTASRFDRARSCNKLFEHAIAGAVGVYPQDWPPARMAGNGAILAPGDPACWAGALAQAVAQRRQLADMAATAAQSLSHHDTGTMQRAIWSDFFKIEI